MVLHMCAYKCQQAISDVLPQKSSTLVFESGPLTGLSPTLPAEL